MKALMMKDYIAKNYLSLSIYMLIIRSEVAKVILPVNKKKIKVTSTRKSCKIILFFIMDVWRSVSYFLLC